MIDWTDPKSQITEHFTVGDAAMLHHFNRLATEDDGLDVDKIVALCYKMEDIRSILGCPINVHCMFRSQEYNASMNFKPISDVHSMCLAVDFDCGLSLSTDQVKDKLMDKLESLGIRMENNGERASWVHIDTYKVGPSGRFFKT